VLHKNKVSVSNVGVGIIDFIKQIAFEFTRPEIERVLHESVLTCRFDIWRAVKFGPNGMAKRLR
jgi:hypothetical protein